jgi:hypothetical protein
MTHITQGGLNHDRLLANIEERKVVLVSFVSTQITVSKFVCKLNTKIRQALKHKSYNDWRLILKVCQIEITQGGLNQDRLHRETLIKVIIGLCRRFH